MADTCKDFSSNSADPKSIQDLTAFAHKELEAWLREAESMNQTARLMTSSFAGDITLLENDTTQAQLQLNALLHNVLQVQNLLQQMQDKFQNMSDQIITRNDMGNRIDDLEKNIADLMTQAGVDDRS